MRKERIRWHFAGGATFGNGNARMLEKVVSLTAAQIKNLQSAPVTLIAAPGAGKIIEIESIVAMLDYATAVFTGSNNLEFRYTGAAGDKVTADLAYAFLNAGADAYRVVKSVVTELTPVVNALVCVCVPTANPGGETAASTLKFRIRYHIVTLF